MPFDWLRPTTESVHNIKMMTIYPDVWLQKHFCNEWNVDKITTTPQMENPKRWCFLEMKRWAKPRWKCPPKKREREKKNHHPEIFIIISECWLLLALDEQKLVNFFLARFLLLHHVISFSFRRLNYGKLLLVAFERFILCLWMLSSMLLVIYHPVGLN